jgi:hypothetical protein
VFGARVFAFLTADITPGSGVGAGSILKISLVACLIVKNEYFIPATI